MLMEFQISQKYQTEYNSDLKEESNHVIITKIGAYPFERGQLFIEIWSNMHLPWLQK